MQTPGHIKSSSNSVAFSGVKLHFWTQTEFNVAYPGAHRYYHSFTKPVSLLQGSMAFTGKLRASMLESFASGLTLARLFVFRYSLRTIALPNEP
jgi:hypothetical protein